jgi:outer membrane biosynthesis protein TonB
MPTMPSPPSARTEGAQPGDRTIRNGVIALWTAVIVAALVIIALMLLGDRDSAATALPSIVAGTPGGFAVANATPSPDSTPTPTPPPSATPRPTSEPSATPRPTTEATAVATPVPATAAPVATPTPAPTTAPPSVAPTPIVVAASDPTEAVAAFYAYVSSGQFDAAYSLWSERMRATYPRQENLDERFDQTASIVFQELHVVEQTSEAATVQANFTETYDSGSSRAFVGYWRLVLVDGDWLLDEPHY